MKSLIWFDICSACYETRNGTTLAHKLTIWLCWCFFSHLAPASDYGVRLPILRSSPEDQILYQTERYNEDTFGYEVPIREEGDYILVMKYAEVYFAQSQQKV